MKKVMLAVLIITSFMVSSVYAVGQGLDAYRDSGNVSDTAVITMEDANVPGLDSFTVETLSAGNYDVEESTTTTSPNKGRDGAACSGNDECSSDVCEGGSCCTAHGASCDSSSHCCGHQSCVNNICPE